MGGVRITSNRAFVYRHRRPKEIVRRTKNSKTHKENKKQQT